MRTAAFAAYRGAAEGFRRYWECYGRSKALFFSPYLHLAVVLTFALNHYWRFEPWWGEAIAVLPNLIGFSLGGYAIWLGFGDDKFRALLAGSEETGGASPYMRVSATFVHFVVAELVALVLALCARGLNFPVEDSAGLLRLLLLMNLSPQLVRETVAPIGHGLGFLVFCYAILTGLAAAMALFRVSSWFDRAVTMRQPALRPGVLGTLQRIRERRRSRQS